MAKRRHGGLGRGLDALIPQKPWAEPEKEEKKKEEPKEESGKGPGMEPVSSSDNNTEGTAADSGSVKSDSSESESTQGKTADAESSGIDVSGQGAGRQTSSMGITADEEGAVRTLRLSQIDPNRSQPRQNFEDESLEELADSIRQFGVLQPILVQKKGNR